MVKKKGVSSILLIIIIIVISVFLALIIRNLIADDISEPGLDKIKTEVENFKTELQDYINSQKNVDKEYNSNLLFASEGSVVYDGKTIEGINIYNILPSANEDKYKGSFEIKEGRIIFVTSGQYHFTKQEIFEINKVLQ